MAIAGMRTKGVPSTMIQIRRFLRNPSRKFSSFSSPLVLEPDLRSPGFGHCTRWTPRCGGGAWELLRLLLSKVAESFSQYHEHLLHTWELFESGNTRLGQSRSNLSSSSRQLYHHLRIRAKSTWLSRRDYNGGRTPMVWRNRGCSLCPTPQFLAGLEEVEENSARGDH